MSSKEWIKPTNLYELCEQVCDAIELSPANYYQGDWARDTKRNWRDRTGQPADAVCGTSFCRAGWMVAILEADKKRTTYDWIGVDIPGRATHLLRKAGIPENDIDTLFSGGACGMERFGTPEYTAAGLKGMHDFMAKNEDKLRAASLEDPSK